MSRLGRARTREKGKEQRIGKEMADFATEIFIFNKDDEVLSSGSSGKSGFQFAEESQRIRLFLKT
jgi:hypothetical protein